MSYVSPKAPRWRWAVLTVIVVGALTVPTGIVYLQHRLHAQPTDIARPWDDPNIAQKLSDARLSKAKSIRSEWRRWAIEHKEGLRAMLASDGKEFSTAQAIYKVSPPVTLSDWRPDTQSGPAKFGWFVDTEKQMANGSKITWADADSAATFEKQKGAGEKKLRQEYADKSDFTVAVSDNAGPTSTYLWASGRITETTWIRNPNRSKGQRSAITVSKELVPPFDFLTSADSG